MNRWSARCFNKLNAVVVGPDVSIYVADGHDAQGMITAKAVAEGISRGATSRISNPPAVSLPPPERRAELPAPGRGRGAPN